MESLIRRPREVATLYFEPAEVERETTLGGLERVLGDRSCSRSFITIAESGPRDARDLARRAATVPRDMAVHPLHGSTAHLHYIHKLPTTPTYMTR